MAGRADPPGGVRRLGRSRAYVPGDIPGRLFDWHAPRPGRWERLCVTRGELHTERRDGASVLEEVCDSKAAQWFAPGASWKVARIGPDTRFKIEVYAETMAEHAADISPERATLLLSVNPVCLDAVADLKIHAGTMKVGECALIHGRFDWKAVRSELVKLYDEGFSWHPLVADAASFTAFMMRADGPVESGDYLTRDHAVIESALYGLLHGYQDRERTSWLRNLLVRHIRIEEELIFPHYLKAGGRAAWVRSLEIEHGLIRQELDLLETGSGVEQLVRLLDDHDEKEERIIYPDVARRLVPDSRNLARAAFLFP